MMMQAMRAWVDEHRSAGRLETVFGFAGVPGGGAIASVDSLEELDGMMAGFPFGGFSDIDVYGLVDIDGALDRFDEAMQKMMGDGG